METIKRSQAILAQLAGLFVDECEVVPFDAVLNGSVVGAHLLKAGNESRLFSEQKSEDGLTDVHLTAVNESHLLAEQKSEDVLTPLEKRQQHLAGIVTD